MKTEASKQVRKGWAAWLLGGGCAAFLGMASTMAAPPGGAVVERVQGTVAALDTSRKQQRPLRAGDTVAKGEYVRTGADSSVVLRHSDGKQQRIGASSEVHLAPGNLRPDSRHRITTTPESLKAIR